MDNHYLLPLSYRTVIALLLVFSVIGCGDGTAVVRGTVAVNGEPMSDGSVTFEPADGNGRSVGTQITDGRFEVPAGSRMTPGNKKVTIRGSIKTGKQVPAAPPAPPGVMVDDLKFYPPPGGQPEIKEAEVKEGDNELRFELTAKQPGKAK